MTVLKEWLQKHPKQTKKANLEEKSSQERPRNDQTETEDRLVAEFLSR